MQDNNSEKQKINNQEKLNEMYELVQENNEMLHSLIRRERFASFMRILYWVIVFGGIFGVYYYLQPYINQATANYKAVQSAVQKVNDMSADLPETKNLKNIFDTIKSSINPSF